MEDSGSDLNAFALSGLDEECSLSRRVVPRCERNRCIDDVGGRGACIR